MSSVEDFLRGAEAALTAGGRPEATYRLQFHAGFTFRDALEIVPYLHALGVTHAYASPILRARPGSTHGYDIIDHSCLNPELGTREDFDAWADALRGRGMGLILDVVPNHMGVGTNDNAWWNDVLENGPAARHAGHFDIAWDASHRPELHGKVLLPRLGESYGEALEGGRLRLGFAAGAFTIHYHEHSFPVAPRTYARPLGHAAEGLGAELGPESPALAEYHSILTAIRNLPDRLEREPARVAERQREKEVIKRRLAHLCEVSPQVLAHIGRSVEHFNGMPGDPRSFDHLHDLLDHQCYRLADWRVASDEINYRRFFDVNDLAALSMEREEVFDAAHTLVFDLLAEGRVHGLRIDHPDGLYDPAGYFRRLQEGYVRARARRLFDEAGLPAEAWAEASARLAEPRPLYVVAEKILAGDERGCPEGWACHGTSGYEALNMLNGLFVSPAGQGAFTRLYNDWVQDSPRFAEVAYRGKQLILRASLSSELHMLAHQLDRLAQKSRRSRDLTFNRLRGGLREVIACFPVYRPYITGEGPLDEADRRHIEAAVRRAAARNPHLSRAVFQFIRSILLEDPQPGDAEAHAERRRFAGKFQQVTAPVMAKGVEDTAFYVYNRLASLNEVGGEPTRFGVSPETLHAFHAARRTRSPHALTPLSTHDTKRGEDVRARINVLSEMPDEWGEAITRWGRLNAAHRREVEGRTAPDPNEEYLLYQTLVGAWPLVEPSAERMGGFVGRIQDYMTKALFEAKVHTSWVNQDAEYVRAVRDFVAAILGDGSAFLADFRAFQGRVGRLGLLNSLAQTLLRLTGPGVPDTYQGTELWDFSLVDPDNRRPVDYGLRQRMLCGLQDARDARGLANELANSLEDGRAKLYLTWRALAARRENAGLFSSGGYTPLEVTGRHAGHLFAFAREQGDRRAVVAVPRLLARMPLDGDGLPLGPGVWAETEVRLPEGLAGLRWRDALTGETLAEGAALPAGALLGHFPAALLLSVP